MPVAPPGMQPPVGPVSAPPVEAAGPGPADVAALQGKEDMARMEAIAASAPTPTKAYTVSVIQSLIAEFNDFVEALAGEEIPDVVWKPAEGGAKHVGPLPPQIWVPLVALEQVLGQFGGKLAAKYALDLADLVDDGGLRGTAANLRRASKDKKLLEQLRSAGGPPPAMPMGGEAGMDMGAPPPAAMNEADQALMAGM